MFLNEVVSKINNIKWCEVRSKFNKENSQLGEEYLRRLATFFKEESIKPVRPVIANIARLLGDTEEIKISDYCSKEATEFLSKEMYFGKIFEYYIQLAKYAKNNPSYSKYLSIYEPLIRIAEKGGFFVLKASELDIMEASHIPLDNWYEKFIEIDPIDINNI